MKEKLKLLDLSKDFEITNRYINGNQEYKIEDLNSDLYAIIPDNGEIEYYITAYECYECQIVIDRLLKLKEYIEFLKGDDK